MSEIENIIEKLASSSVEEKPKEVSFVGQSRSLNTEEDAADIVKAINDCPGMTTLRLEGNTVGIPAAKAIGKALETQSDFKYALWKDMFTGRDKTEIPDALKHLSAGIMKSNARLIVLDLSDNAFGPRGLVGIQKLLESPACYTLEELHLNNNGLGITGAKLLSESLLNCHANSLKSGTPMKLRTFVCGRNRLENPGSIAMSKFLQQLGTLESVAMPQNGIYHEGIKGLSAAFAANPHLKVINLEDNSLTHQGVQHICKVLEHLKELQVLNLGDCLVRTEGAIDLAAVLERSCSDLIEVNLGFNEINGEGGMALATALKNKQKLQSVNLNGNAFGPDACNRIKDLFQTIKKAEILAPLCDDEEEDDDDENDEHYDEDEEDDGETGSEGEEDDGQHSSDGGDNNSHRSPMSKVGPPDFLANPTSEALLQLHRSNEDFSSVLPSEPTVRDYVQLFYKTSIAVKPEDKDALSAACSYADNFLARAFKLGAGDISNFNNTFLAGIGLIKEEGKKKPSSVVDISGVLVVLEHAVRQPYFDDSTRKMLQFFLSRPMPFVSATSKANHILMTALYQL